MSEEAKTRVCGEIVRIMNTYREQEARGCVGTPGGLEHMGDVWKLLGRWSASLQDGDDPDERRFEKSYA